MNIKNNRKRRETRREMEDCLLTLLQTKDFIKITVSDICKLTGHHRSTFYANYLDIFDLADKIRDRLEEEVRSACQTNSLHDIGMDYHRLFCHIKENPALYTAYFKLGYDSRHQVDLTQLSGDQGYFPEDHLDFHVEFHKAGLNAIIKKWLSSGCKESPEEMTKIIQDEYRRRK